MTTVIIIKLIALVLAIAYGITIIGKIHHKQGIPATIIYIEAISLVAFLAIQFKLYL